MQYLECRRGARPFPSQQARRWGQHGLRSRIRPNRGTSALPVKPSFPLDVCSGCAGLDCLAGRARTHTCVLRTYVRRRVCLFSSWLWWRLTLQRLEPGGFAAHVQRSCRKAPSPLRKRGDTMRYDAARYDTGSATSDPATSETTSPSSTRHQPSAVWVRHCLFGLFRCITLDLTSCTLHTHITKICRGPVSPAQDITSAVKQNKPSYPSASLGLLDGTNPLMTARCKRGARAEPSLTRIRISMDDFVLRAAKTTVTRHHHRDGLLLIYGRPSTAGQQPTPQTPQTRRERAGGLHSPPWWSWWCCRTPIRHTTPARIASLSHPSATPWPRMPFAALALRLRHCKGQANWSIHPVSYLTYVECEMLLHGAS